MAIIQIPAGHLTFQRTGLTLHGYTPVITNTLLASVPAVARLLTGQPPSLFRQKYFAPAEESLTLTAHDPYGLVLIYEDKEAATIPDLLSLTGQAPTFEIRRIKRERYRCVSISSRRRVKALYI